MIRQPFLMVLTAWQNDQLTVSDGQADWPTDRPTYNAYIMHVPTHTHTHTHTQFLYNWPTFLHSNSQVAPGDGSKRRLSKQMFPPVSQRELSNHRKLKASLLTSEINQLDFILRPSSNSNFSTSIHNVAKILVYIHNVILYYFFYTKFSKHYTIRL